MRKVLILFAFLISIINAASAAIRVSPGYVEIDGNKTKKDYITGAFTVEGGKDETVRFKIYPVFFEYDTKGRFVELEDNAQKNSLIGKLKFYPMEFTCKNGNPQKIRFTITNLKTLPTGESRLVLFLEDVDTKEIVIRKANGQAGGKIIVKTRVGVPVYLDRGMYTKRGTLDAIALKKVGDEFACEYKISSHGNSKIRYSGMAMLSQGGKLIKTMDVYGMTVEGGKFLDTAQRLDFPKDQIVAGQEYKLKFVLTYRDEKGSEKVLKKEITFIPEKLTTTKI